MNWRLWTMLPQRLRYTVYSVPLVVGKWLYGSGNHPFLNFTQRLPFNLYCKHTRIETKEILATLFVSQNTTIPVPKILDVIDLPEGDHRRHLVIMTGLMPSRTLSDVNPSLLVQDVRNILLQLRALIPPSNSCVTGFPDGPLLAVSPQRSPFPSINDFPTRPFSRLWR